MQPPEIIVSIASQTLTFYHRSDNVKCYPISSSRFGVGEKKGSYQTPRGKHIVRAKIGDNAPLNAVFVGRRVTGEIYKPAMREAFPGRDWILTRILWLSGKEIGKNRLNDVDSMQRYIYIHGTPDDEPIGIPNSHGCIRMRNHDIVDLFMRVPYGCLVNIQDK